MSGPGRAAIETVAKHWQDLYRAVGGETVDSLCSLALLYSPKGVDSTGKRSVIRVFDAWNPTTRPVGASIARSVRLPDPNRGEGTTTHGDGSGWVHTRDKNRLVNSRYSM